MRQRRGLGQPRTGVDVGAAVPVLAVPHLVIRIDRQLQRPQRRVGAQLVRGVLIKGLPGPKVGSLGPLRQHAAQPPAMRPRVDPASFVRRHHPAVAETTDDDDVLPQRLERLERRREDKVPSPLAPRMKTRQEHPVRDIEKGHPRCRGRRRLGRGRQGRGHGVKKRQGDRGPEAPQ